MDSRCSAFFLLLGATCATAQENPYEMSATLTLESIHNFRGGVERGSRELANLDLTLAIDTQAAGWWNYGSWFVYVLGDYGRDPAELTGDLQTLSNIAAPNALKIYEFWYQHKFADDTTKLLVGLHNYNAVFDVTESASLFSMAPFGIGPDIAQAGPSIFPTTSMAAVLQWQSDVFYLNAGVYDGIPGDPDNPRGTHVQFNKGDGLFKTLELGAVAENQYKLGVGRWQQTATVENPVDGSTVNSNHGWYSLGEYYFNPDLVAFMQYGRADEDKNQLDNYLGGGLRRNNIWKQGDAVGLAVARAHNGVPFLQYNPELLAAETIWELTLMLPLAEHFSMKSSLYYVQHPGMSPELNNALALGLRLYIDF